MGPLSTDPRLWAVHTISPPHAWGMTCVLIGPNIMLPRLPQGLRYMQGPCLWARTFQVHKERFSPADEHNWRLGLSNRGPDLTVPEFGPLWIHREGSFWPCKVEEATSRYLLVILMHHWPLQWGGILLEESLIWSPSSGQEKEASDWILWISDKITQEHLPPDASASS